MASDTNTAAGRTRITYIEEKPVHNRLEQIATETGLTVSHLIRQATWDYLKTRGDSDQVVERDPARAAKKAAKKAARKK